MDELLSQARQLRFAGGMESDFWVSYSALTRSTIRFSFALATVIYGAFGILDLWCLPVTHRGALMLRGFVVCPLLAGIAALTLRAALYRWIQPAMAFASVASGAGIILIIALSRPSELGYTHYYVGLILVMMFVYSFIRLRFWLALGSNATMFVLYEYMAATEQGVLGTSVGATAFVANNFFLVGANVIGGFTCYWLEVAARRDFIQRLAIEAEKAKSDRLLLNVLPEVIVERMKRGGEPIADEFPGVSVLFADLVNFSVLSATVTAQELVQLLNELFTAFDRLVEKHGLEKIKTIGDCYMAASGVPIPRTDHASALTKLALDMRRHLESPETNHGGVLKVRIGINSGPVVAGVIGTTKFIYDLWGDTVNTASRMESHGKIGQIQVSKATFDLIRTEFETEYGGVKPVKGKGNMDVWYVLDRRTE